MLPFQLVPQEDEIQRAKEEFQFGAGSYPDSNKCNKYESPRHYADVDDDDLDDDVGNDGTGRRLLSGGNGTGAVEIASSVNSASYGSRNQATTLPLSPLK